MRHDVDIDISKAYEMAVIEKSLKIKSTYFFLTTSKLYNCLEKSNRDMIKKISDLGHQIGLHFDLSNLKKNSFKKNEKKFDLEKRILENCIGREIKTISFHKPGINGIPKGIYYNEMINVYSSIFIKKILYYSDSKGDWRFGIPTKDKNILDNKKSIQLLIHPVWWISKKKYTSLNNSLLLKSSLKNNYSDKFNYLQSYKKFN